MSRGYWLTCGMCSSLGLDKVTGTNIEAAPKQGVCDSCGGPWPAATRRQEHEFVNGYCVHCKGEAMVTWLLSPFCDKREEVPR